MSRKVIAPARKIQGSVCVPGDKSISHRALMLAALADGESRITNLGKGADVCSTANCLQGVGAKLELAGSDALVTGRGMSLRASNEALDVGNSGTSIRLLSGILAGQPFESCITGDESIRRRPMRRIIEPLRLMGANIGAREDGYAPLNIAGGALEGIEYTPPVASAQVKTSVLFAGLFARGLTTVRELQATRDHTERMLPVFGVALKRNGTSVSVAGPVRLQATTLVIPGDFSSAAYWIAAALMAEHGEVVVEKVGINPTRTAFLGVLREMGADIEIQALDDGGSEPVANIIARSSKLRALRVDSSLVPLLVDEIPLLAVLATQAEGTSEIRGAAELRFKESDRIHATAVNLQKLGGNVEPLEDGFKISGPCRLRFGSTESFQDHRIAMAMAVAGLISKGVEIDGGECAGISYPDFYADLESLRNE